MMVGGREQEIMAVYLLAITGRNISCSRLMIASPRCSQPATSALGMWNLHRMSLHVRGHLLAPLPPTLHYGERPLQGHSLPHHSHFIVPMPQNHFDICLQILGNMRQYQK
ncbi:hypothetical protein GOP47_0021517 [Adiantum capillus-veneris]|uniref:Uncharacterized protein n=1 Tax=Adiantum capillus-veneris TaxID=13818 RepID=A0A9D4U8B3_ADICA|nr:hypothetical protein GOP47_0021517 [Adiantum capillus-veneris]